MDESDDINVDIGEVNFNTYHHVLPQESVKESNGTVVFPIAAILAVAGFIILISKLPFPEDYNFFQKAGVAVVCLITGLLIFAIVRAVVHFTLKAIVEILVVALALANVSYLAVCWVKFDKIVTLSEELGILEHATTFKTIFMIITSLFLFDAVMFLILFPLARLAKSTLLDNKEL